MVLLCRKLRKGGPNIASELDNRMNWPEHASFAHCPERVFPFYTIPRRSQSNSAPADDSCLFFLSQVCPHTFPPFHLQVRGQSSGFAGDLRLLSAADQIPQRILLALFPPPAPSFSFSTPAITSLHLPSCFPLAVLGLSPLQLSNHLLPGPFLHLASNIPKNSSRERVQWSGS